MVTGPWPSDFSVNSGVLKGNVLSPLLLFSLRIDFSLLKVAEVVRESFDWRVREISKTGDMQTMRNTTRSTTQLNRKYHISREVGLEVNFREDCVQMGGIILYRERISEAVFQMYNNIHSGSLELDFRGLKNDQSDKVRFGNQID